MARILIIDDDPAMVQVISDICSEAGHTPIAYNSGHKALGLMLGHAPQLIVSDIRMDGVSGIDVLRAARVSLPSTPVILVTANKHVEVAVEAMRWGATDYVLKPFKVDDLRAAIQRALERGGEVVSPSQPSSAQPASGSFDSIVGRAPRMRELFEIIEKVANTDSTILISGESGTGKELVAKALHFNSGRQSQPFVAINCSALPENLLESELFGHKKGAFTGAFQDKIGLFEEAEGGTIFLDEINSMAPLLQTKLLRVLQERTLRRVGDNRNIPIHVRVLAATNEPLYEKMKAGGFREDLYYRLAVIPLEVPALRERREDVPLLVDHFLRKHTRSRNLVTPLRIEADASEALFAYPWPGNVRELENALERASALCDGGIVALKDLPPHVVRPLVHGPGASANAYSSALPIGASLEKFIAEQEHHFIAETLRHTNGVRERAAEMLGISSATLYRKLEAARAQPKRKAAPKA